MPSIAFNYSKLVTAPTKSMTRHRSASARDSPNRSKMMDFFCSATTQDAKYVSKPQFGHIERRPKRSKWTKTTSDKVINALDLTAKQTVAKLCETQWSQTRPIHYPMRQMQMNGITARLMFSLFAVRFCVIQRFCIQPNARDFRDLSATQTE